MRSLSGTLLMTALVLSPASVLAQAPPVSPPPSDLPATPADPSAPFALTDSQRAAIRDAVRQVDASQRAKVPANLSAPLNVSVGVQLPPSIQLAILPDRALAQAPGAKTVQYTVISNQIVLVDPTNMRVVDIINL